MTVEVLTQHVVSTSKDARDEKSRTFLFSVLCLWLWSTMFYYNHLGVPSAVRPDRILAVFVGFLAIRAQMRGLFSKFKFGFLEFLMLLFTGACFLSLVVSGSNRTVGVGANTEINEVFNLTIYPYLTYLIARQIPYSRRRFLWFLGVMVLIGAYLGFTAIFERYDMDTFIFPKYIADMSIGIHQGRSRGPFLQAVFMGYNLIVCLFCIYLRLSEMRSRTGFLLLLVFAFAIILGIYFTNTRGAWLALALGLMAASTLRSSVRRIAIGVNLVLALGFFFSGASQFSLSGGNLFTKRQNTLEQRDLNYRIAFHMGLDHPLTGVGFSRMGYEFDKYFVKYYKGEEWQGWDGNHNEYLGLFAEVGITAPLLYSLILFLVGKRAFSGSRYYPPEMALERSLAVCTVGALFGFALISYFNQVRAAPFHICIIFLLAGIAASARDAVLQANQEMAPA